MERGPVSQIHKAYKLFGMLLILLLGLTGCGKDPVQGLPGGAAPAVIELWHSLQGSEAEALSKQAQRIMTGHPEVIVRLEYVPEDKLANQAYQAQAGGEGPEIFLTSGEALTALFNQGALSPVLGSTDSFPSVVSQFHHGEKDYALPIVTDIPLLYYRTDLAQPPANLAGFLTTKGILALPTLDTRTLTPWWSGQAGKLTNNGQPTLDDPSNLIFLQQLLAWKDAKLLTVDANAWLQFVNGQAAYTINWAGQAKGLAQTIPWGSALLTQFTGGQGQILTGRTLGIANSSIKSSEALNPMIRMVEEELLNPDAQWALGQAGNRFPTSTSFYKRTEAQSGVLQQVGQGLEKAWPLKGASPEWKLIPLQDQAWQKAWIGIAPDSALAAAQAEAVKALSQK
jgi:multiple sugar transport system substrate-binding protein